MMLPGSPRLGAMYSDLVLVVIPNNTLADVASRELAPRELRCGRPRSWDAAIVVFYPP